MNESKKIIVYTCIGHNSAPYSEFLRSTMEDLKSGENQIYYRCVRTIDHPVYKENERLPVGWENISDISAHNISNSMTHAMNLNYVKDDIGCFFRTNLFVICDSDTAILMKEWDKIIVNNLIKNDFVILENNKKIPEIFFVAFNFNGWCSLLRNNIDFFPKTYENSEKCVKEKYMSKTIKCDTGYKLKKYLMANNNSCIFLPRTNRMGYTSNENKKICDLKPTHMQQWGYCGLPFITHLQAGRSDSISSKFGKAWIDRVKHYNRKVNEIQ